MDKHRICKICNRRFANGKAMGGHMRSHFAKHPISSSNINPSPPKYPSSSSSLSNMQTYRSVNNRPFSGLEDESEAESSRNLTKARSKRPLRTIESVMVDEDEYVRGKSDDGDNDEEEDKEEDESSLVSRTNKYKCKTCKKEFRSYQALGGHKASHKKIKIHHNGSSDAAAAGDAVVMDQRVFKCPFCDKVFDSGQALGGHKKIHFTYLATPITKITSSAKSSGAKFIDLNLPAPEDDSEVSQV
ncbi:zinc finger protein ZAT9 [Citrus clementina]|uniref:zinc finger protein ZAT9 n=1 Tax=Citrus clementina TaxID=85681 RepID=UPI000CECF52E|nr:zinc finger protein ZAT9 [Citrus x clementina]